MKATVLALLLLILPAAAQSPEEPQNTDPRQAARTELATLSQWKAQAQTSLESSLRAPDLASPEIDALRAKEAELLVALQQTRNAIVDAARQLPAMQEKQKEIDTATQRIAQLRRQLNPQPAPLRKEEK